jgi:hypothetical protein
MFVLSCLNVCIIERVYSRLVLDKCLHFLHVPSINKTPTYLLTYLQLIAICNEGTAKTANQVKQKKKTKQDKT